MVKNSPEVSPKSRLETDNLKAKIANTDGFDYIVKENIGRFLQGAQDKVNSLEVYKAEETSYWLGQLHALLALMDEIDEIKKHQEEK